MRGVFLFTGIVLLCVTLLTFSTSGCEKTAEPELEVGLWTCIGNGLSEHSLEISVKNVGESTAHNIVLTDITIKGLVIYNNRETAWNRDVEPDHTLIDCPNTLFLGFGPFTATMTVTCDEGVTATGTGNGLTLGPLIFVP
jgi:hypothetical protein